MGRSPYRRLDAAGQKRAFALAERRGFVTMDALDAIALEMGA